MVPAARHYYSFRVDPAATGRRLDQVVRDELARETERTRQAELPALGRKVLGQLFSAGRVRCGGRVARKSDLAAAGDLVELELDEIPGTVTRTPSLELRVVYQTEQFVVADKAAGVPSAGTPGGEPVTLAGALLARYPEMALVGYRRAEPGLVHRLDTQTSGLILAARTEEAFLHFRTELERGALTKRYVALTPHPEAPEGVVQLPLGPDPRNRQKVRVLDSGRVRQTSYRVQELRGDVAWLNVELAAGYRHQIRAHLAALGCPLYGDVLYGGEDRGLWPRHALHAAQIAGTGPDGASFDVTSPLPFDLRAFFDAAT